MTGWRHAKGPKSLSYLKKDGREWLRPAFFLVGHRLLAWHDPFITSIPLTIYKVANHNLAKPICSCIVFHRFCAERSTWQLYWVNMKSWNVLLVMYSESIGLRLKAEQENKYNFQILHSFASLLSFTVFQIDCYRTHVQIFLLGFLWVFQRAGRREHPWQLCYYLWVAGWADGFWLSPDNR